MPWSARGWWRAPAVYLAASMASTTKRQKNSEEKKFQVTGRDKRAEESVLKDSEKQTNQIRRERAIRATAGSEQGGVCRRSRFENLQSNREEGGSEGEN